MWTQLPGRGGIKATLVPKGRHALDAKLIRVLLRGRHIFHYHPLPSLLYSGMRLPLLFPDLAPRPVHPSWYLTLPRQPILFFSQPLA